MENILKNISDFAVNYSIKLIGAILILFIGAKLIKFVLKTLSKSRGFSRLDAGAQSFIKSFIKIILYIVLFFTIATLLGVPATSLVALLGSAGLAIGLALQGGLSNLAGGMILLIFKPFNIGDYISSGSESGTVTAIDIFYTTLVTPDNKRVKIPNGVISNQTVTDYSSFDSRRIDLKFSTSYSADIDEVKNTILTAVSGINGILENPEPVVLLSEHADSSINFELRAWCETSKYWDIFFACKESVTRSFNEKGIEIPFPQLDVHFDKER